MKDIDVPGYPTRCWPRPELRETPGSGLSTDDAAGSRLLLSALSHDMRSPLMAINAAVGALRERTLRLSVLADDSLEGPRTAEIRTLPGRQRHV